MNSSLAHPHQKSINSPPSDDSWCVAVAAEFRRKGFKRHADEFERCGLFSRVRTCAADYTHNPRLKPLTCHKHRICVPCARRAARRKVERYVPAAKRAAKSSRRGHSQKHIVLTTNKSPDGKTPAEIGEDVKQHNRHVRQFIQQASFIVQKQKDELSAKEIRRGRCDLKDHEIGAFWGNEFGEEGHKLHSHILYQGPYLDKFELLTPLWKEITGGDCEITYIRRINADQVEDEVTEITKYITKFTALSPYLAVILFEALKGVRTFHSVGIFHGLKAAEPVQLCEVCGSHMTTIAVTEYLESCNLLNVQPLHEILEYERDLEASEADKLHKAVQVAAASKLDLKHGINCGEAALDRDPVRSYRRANANPNPFAPGYEYPLRQ